MFLLLDTKSLDDTGFLSRIGYPDITRQSVIKLSKFQVMTGESRTSWTDLTRTHAILFKQADHLDDSHLFLEAALALACPFARRRRRRRRLCYVVWASCSAPSSDLRSALSVLGAVSFSLLVCKVYPVGIPAWYAWLLLSNRHRIYPKQALRDGVSAERRLSDRKIAHTVFLWEVPFSFSSSCFESPKYGHRLTV